MSTAVRRDLIFVELIFVFTNLQRKSRGQTRPTISTGQTVQFVSPALPFEENKVSFFFPKFPKSPTQIGNSFQIVHEHLQLGRPVGQLQGALQDVARLAVQHGYAGGPRAAAELSGHMYLPGQDPRLKFLETGSVCCAI